MLEIGCTIEGSKTYLMNFLFFLLEGNEHHRSVRIRILETRAPDFEINMGFLMGKTLFSEKIDSRFRV